MTREEAIKQLKYCKSIHNGSFGPALKIAIKTLEQEPKSRMTVTELEDIKHDICFNICKYLFKNMTDEEYDKLLVERCENCPLNRLEEGE